MDKTSQSMFLDAVNSREKISVSNQIIALGDEMKAKQLIRHERDHDESTSFTHHLFQVQIIQKSFQFSEA